MNVFNILTDEIKRDEEFVYHLLINYPNQYLDALPILDNLIDNEEFIMKLILNFPNDCEKIVSRLPKLKTNPDFILRVIDKCPESLIPLFYKLRTNSEFVLKLFEQYPNRVLSIFSRLDDDLKNNYDFVMEVITKHPIYVFEIYSELTELKNDEKFMLHMFNTCPGDYPYLYNQLTDLKYNKQFGVKVLQLSLQAPKPNYEPFDKYGSDKNDDNFYKETKILQTKIENSKKLNKTMKEHVTTLKYLSEVRDYCVRDWNLTTPKKSFTETIANALNLKNNRRYVWYWINRNPNNVVKMFSEYLTDLKNDSDFVIEVMTKYPLFKIDIFSTLTKLKNDKNFVLKLCTDEDYHYFYNQLTDLKSNKEFNIEMLKRFKDDWRVFARNLKNDKSFISKIIDEYSTNYIDVFSILDDLKNDEDIINQLITKYPNNRLDILHELAFKS